MIRPRTFDEFFIAEFELKGSPVRREDAYQIWMAACEDVQGRCNVAVAALFEICPPPDGQGAQDVEVIAARAVEYHRRKLVEAYQLNEDMGKVIVLQRARRIEDEAELAKLRDLLRSARAIADRQGDRTAWARFSASIGELGIGSVTPRTYRILPSDEPPVST